MSYSRTGILVKVLHETDAAIKVSFDEDEEPVWLALAYVEVERKNGDIWDITIPAKVAIDKGMV